MNDRRLTVPVVLGQQAGAAPEARRRIGHAAATWLSLVLVAVAGLGALVVWHLVRRGRLIRERLGPPRVVRLPDLEPPATAAVPPPREEPLAP
jgi:hypothetical protein